MDLKLVENKDGLVSFIAPNMEEFKIARDSALELVKSNGIKVFINEVKQEVKFTASFRLEFEQAFYSKYGQIL